MQVPRCLADWHSRSLPTSPFNLSPASQYNPPSPADLRWQVEVAPGCPWPPLHGGLAWHWIRTDHTRLTLCLRVSESRKEPQVSERLFWDFFFPTASAMSLTILYLVSKHFQARQSQLRQVYLSVGNLNVSENTRWAWSYLCFGCKSQKVPKANAILVLSSRSLQSVCFCILPNIPFLAQNADV